ncbi:DEAD/DEAH box helicase [Peptococcaceae bacterium 1198_IL3148]
MPRWENDNTEEIKKGKNLKSKIRIKSFYKKTPLRKETQPVAPAGPFQLDDFQAEAIEAVLAGRNVLVAAPTGTGKTLIAEKLAEKLMDEGMGLIYTSPLKALSNQKYADFREMFGDERVGLVTGDVTINGDAMLTVMTTEIFRNKCFEDVEQLANIAYVVFDEIHYLDDPHRGTSWEEAILFAPPHMKILGLSATVPNVKEMATWIAEVRNAEVLVVEERKRAVPLEINWVTPDNEIINEHEAKRQVKKLSDKRKEEQEEYKARKRNKFYN